MKVFCIGSSSSGNCYIMQFSDDKSNYKQTVMVEAGFNWKDIIKKSISVGCNTLLTDITSCIVTHEHSDHAKGIRQVISSGIDVYASKSTHTREGTLAKGKIIADGTTTCIAPQIYVYSFKVEHDAPESLGFIISCKATGELILFVNDCKYYSQDLSKFKFDYIFIECNYEPRQTHIIYNQAVKDNDHIRMAQYKRVIDSHMSLTQTKKSLQQLNLEKCKGIFLMHLSDRNANEYVMKREIKELTGIPTYVCQKNGGIK